MVETLGIALAANLLLGLIGHLAGALDRAGAATGAVLGTLIWLGLGPAGWGLLALFVVAGSAMTRYGYAEKQARGHAEERGGRRGWRNAVANAGVAAACSLGAMLGGDLWLAAAIGSLAAALADTTESELGSIIGRRAYLPPRFRPVPPGTEGAVSLAGSAAGLCAALALAAAAAAAGLVAWPLVLPVGLAGFAATVVESLVAAGRRFGNHLLNLLTTALGAGFAAAAAWLLS